jgi:hypothetical protein
VDIIPRGNENYFIECLLLKINEKSSKFKTKSATVKFQVFRERNALQSNRLKIENISKLLSK